MARQPLLNRTFLSPALPGESDFRFYKARERLRNRASSDVVINFKQSNLPSLPIKRLKNNFCLSNIFL